MNDLSRAMIAELIGTFALVFVGAGAAALSLGGLVGVAFAHGLVIVSFAYAYGHISGTHINPAVTIGVWAGGEMGLGKALSYILAQLVGGVAAGYALLSVLGSPDVGQLGATLLAQDLRAGGGTVTITPGQGFFLEALLTFFLANAVLHCAVAGKARNHAGLAIGLTLTLSILLAGPLTGGSLNPARTLGPALAAQNYADIWVYLVGTPVGAIVAGLVYRFVLTEKHEKPEKH